jgi:SAM-dependent methyltransferase
MSVEYHDTITVSTTLSQLSDPAAPCSTVLSVMIVDRSPGVQDLTLPARLYEWECRQVLGRTDQDVDFWLEVAQRAGGPVLELACGTGRVTGPLAAAGFDVIGLDVDPGMLAYGRQGPFPLPRLIAADMRHFALHQLFAAVIVPYNSFQLLTDPADVSACLQCVRDHLVPGGVFGLEVTDFQAGAVRTAVADEILATGFLGEDPLTLSGSLTHDFASRISQYQRCFRSTEWKREDVVTIRSYGVDELRNVLAEGGLTVDALWQDDSTVRVLARHFEV